MARVYGPLFSLDARGTLGKAIVYSNWKGLGTVRMWLKPYNPNSALQQAQRQIIANAVLGWQSLAPGIKANWDSSASGKSTKAHPLSGFNLFVREYAGINDFPPNP